MAQDLPDDVWTQVAETPWCARGAHQSVSLTSRRMHRLVVPMLFRDIQFRVVNAEFKSLLAMVVRETLRARFLFNSPELLRHTRCFFFWEYFHILDSLTDYLATQEGSDESSWRGDVVNLLTVLHDAIFCLIFRMPGLRKLYICDTVMTPLLYIAISSRPLLTTLSLDPRHVPDITPIAPAPPNALSLRHFAYYNTWLLQDHPVDPYLTDILDHCILDLERLAVDSALIPAVFSRIPLHHTLSLRSLKVRFPRTLSKGPAVVALLQVLRICPQLRHLETYGHLPDVELTQYLPPPILPNLTTISGTTRLLQTVSGETDIKKIYIHNCFRIKDQSVTQIIRSSPMHLRELSMGQVVVSQTPHELWTFITALAVFRNLERLTIAYEHDMSWSHHVSTQDSHGTVKDILDQLPCLCFLEIQCDDHGGCDIECPFYNKDELAVRGHPSLEAKYVDFTCGKRSWDSQTGWEEIHWVP